VVGAVIGIQVLVNVLPTEPESTRCSVAIVGLKTLILVVHRVRTSVLYVTE